MSTLISRLYNWVTDKGNSVKITASKMDAENDQLITALNRKTLCSASAPDSPIAGQTWVDTTNKLLKVYLNNEWKTVSDDTTLLGTIYPIGSLYMSTLSTNPNTLLGFGTWTAFGAGKVMVGYNSSDSDFDTGEKTGGEKTHTLSAAESGLPAHQHNVLYRDSAGVGYPALAAVGGNQENHLTDANTAAAASSAHNNLQPYIVVYMWKRTA